MPLNNMPPYTWPGMIMDDLVNTEARVNAAKIGMGGVTNSEYQCLDGATSPLQGQIDTLNSNKQNTITGAATTIVSANLTTARGLVSDVNGKVAAGTATSTEMGYLSGVTSAIQGQIDASRIKVYNGITQLALNNVKFWVGTATTTSGVATFYPTSDGTSSGTAIFTAIYSAQAVATSSTATAVDVPTSSVKSISGDFKTVQVNVIKGNTISILGALSITFGTNGTNVNLMLMGV